MGNITPEDGWKSDKRDRWVSILDPARVPRSVVSDDAHVHYRVDLVTAYQTVQRRGRTEFQFRPSPTWLSPGWGEVVELKGPQRPHLTVRRNKPVAEGLAIAVSPAFIHSSGFGA